MTRRVQQLLRSLCDTCAIRHSTESKRLLAAVGSLMCVLSWFGMLSEHHFACGIIEGAYMDRVAWTGSVSQCTFFFCLSWSGSAIVYCRDQTRSKINFDRVFAFVWKTRSKLILGVARWRRWYHHFEANLNCQAGRIWNISFCFSFEHSNVSCHGSGWEQCGIQTTLQWNRPEWSICRCPGTAEHSILQRDGICFGNATDTAHGPTVHYACTSGVWSKRYPGADIYD